jgi:hypothetical protein
MTREKTLTKRAQLRKAVYPYNARQRRCDMDAAQLAHVLSAVFAYAFGLGGSARDRSIFWGLCGLAYATLGFAGFAFGSPGEPTSLLGPALDPHLLTPVRGVVELGTMDHLTHFLLGGAFGLASVRAAAAEAVVASSAGAPAPSA